MFQLSFNFVKCHGRPKCEPRPCRTCTVVGRYHYADCSDCRVEAGQNAKRRYWTSIGLDRNGNPKKAKR
jgi:hypothetical protein